MTKVSDLHRKWMKDPKYRRAHEELAPEFELGHGVIAARMHAGITQAQFSKRMDPSRQGSPHQRDQTSERS